MEDQLQKFMFSAAPVRGEIVSLRNTWQEVLARRQYPAPVRDVLGEMMAACALLSANLKFDGTLIMQIFGDGPVKMLVVQCNSDLTMRATAKFAGETGDAIRDGAAFVEMLNANGNGRCVITLDPRDKQPGQQPYQGIVGLEGDSIAEALETYMRQSEQLDSRLWLAADAHCCAGVLLQKLPGDGGRAVLATADTDAWERTTALAATITPEELLRHAADTITRRLFWQERLDHYRPLEPRFECRCSRGRIGRMLLSLGQDEVDSIITELGSVEVTCDFCNARQAFDAIDVAQLFRTGSVNPAGDIPAAAPH